MPTWHRYEELRPDQLELLLKEAPIAYWPLGLLEHHGWHLPIGFDGLKADRICRRLADRTEFILTVLYATLLTYALQVCSAVFRRDGPLALTAKCLAGPLLALLFFLFVRFWLKVDAYRRAIAGRGWRSAGWCTRTSSRRTSCSTAPTPPARARPPSTTSRTSRSLIWAAA